MIQKVIIHRKENKYIYGSAITDEQIYPFIYNTKKNCFKQRTIKLTIDEEDLKTIHLHNEIEKKLKKVIKSFVN
jgi:hypothetical protein